MIENLIQKKWIKLNIAIILQAINFKDFKKSFFKSFGL